MEPSYFYLNNKFPKGVSAKIPSDLKQYGILCGVRGFNYVNFGQKNEGVDMGASDYEGLVAKTATCRCDISFVRYEILSGWGVILGIDFIGNKNLTYAPVPNNSTETFHIMISKNYKPSQELKIFFESEVDRLERSGKLKLFLSKYSK